MRASCHLFPIKDLGKVDNCSIRLRGQIPRSGRNQELACTMRTDCDGKAISWPIFIKDASENSNAKLESSVQATARDIFANSGDQLGLHLNAGCNYALGLSRFPSLVLANNFLCSLFSSSIRKFSALVRS